MITNPIGFFKTFSGSTFDGDAVNFINVAGIVNTTQKNALNTLVKDLKSTNLWTKFYAIYPVLGGTAYSHKYNLINPINCIYNGDTGSTCYAGVTGYTSAVNTAFTLTFTSHWSHTNDGMTPDGIADFADTHFVTDENLVDRDDSHFCIYSRSDIMVATQQDLGCATGTAELMIKPGNGMVDFMNGRGPANSIAATFVNTLGLILLTRESSTSLKAYQNNSQIGATATGIHFPGLNINDIYIGAANDDGVADNFSNRQLSFASIGTALTSGEVSSFYTIVQNYQTTLGREV